MQASNAKKPSQKDWEPAEILCALRLAGYTLSKLAFEHNLKDASGLSVALVRSFPKGEKRIAAAIKKEPQEIWPSRYHEDGTSKPRGARALHVTRDMRERKASNQMLRAA